MDKTATRRTPTFAEYLSTLHEQRRAARRAPTFAEYLSTLHEQRLKAITAEMPRAPLQQLPSRVQRTIAQVVARYASAATAHYGRRGLSRVVWPWTPRPGAETRAPRGRLSNPTALR
ncbi:MAG TPA: hypothetical protein PKK15_07605 [Kouleothrix sp.]|nr:hypothetical protein [Kouleothrix sp.]